jgi:hypothetical protein
LHVLGPCPDLDGFGGMGIGAVATGSTAGLDQHVIKVTYYLTIRVDLSQLLLVQLNVRHRLGWFNSLVIQGQLRRLRRQLVDFIGDLRRLLIWIVWIPIVLVTVGCRGTGQEGVAVGNRCSSWRRLLPCKLSRLILVDIFP